LKLYIDVFVMGLFTSWGACVGFCAPILIPYIAATQKGWLPAFKISVAFSLARIISYVILSLVSATLGQYLIRNFYEGGRGLIIYIAAGSFVVLLGILIFIGKRGFCLPFKKIDKNESAKKGGVKEMMCLGFMIGFAPCLPLLGLLTYIAFNAENVLHGAFLGLSFGAGTFISPLILLGPLAGAGAAALFKKPLVYKIFRCICGLILIYFGTGMIIRALSAI